MNICRIKIRTILWLSVFTALLFSPCAEEQQAVAASPATTIKNLTGEILPSWLPDSLVFNAAIEDEMWSIVKDGEVGPSFFSVGDPVFSPDGKHLTYTAIQDKRALLVVDGKEVSEHDIIFDRENRLFYIANRGKSIYLMQYSF